MTRLLVFWGGCFCFFIALAIPEFEQRRFLFEADIWAKRSDRNEEDYPYTHDQGIGSWLFYCSGPPEA